jgi:hypothetical protein
MDAVRFNEGVSALKLFHDFEAVFVVTVDATQIDTLATLFIGFDEHIENDIAPKAIVGFIALSDGSINDRHIVSNKG